MQNDDRLHTFLNARLAPTLDLLRQMIAINSHTLNPSGVNELGQFTAATFAGLGFDAESVPSSNPRFGNHLVLTRRGTGDKTIGLISHLDTVYSADEEARNNFHWRVEGERIYGPGTDDIKGGTMMMHLVLSTFREITPELFDATNWVLLLDASEEMESADFGKLCGQRLRDAVAALVFEGGRRNGNEFPLVTARKGRASFRIEVEGRGAHAGGDHARGASAIAQLARTVQGVESLTDYTRGITFNVGTISGGSTLNRVPHFAVAEAEMRAFDPAVHRDGLARLRALESDISVRSTKDGYPCRVQITVVNETPPWPRNEATDRLLKVFAEAGRSLGFIVPREERGGISDGNFLCDFVPTIDGLGPKGDNAHCSECSADGSKDQEFVEPSSFVPKAALTVRALEQLLGGSGEK